MIVALIIGREGSVGFPGKNLFPVLGRPLMVYPLLAAKYSRFIDKIYVSTDSEKIKEISKGLGAFIIDRPAALCSKEALGEDAFVHGYKYIKNALKIDIEFMVLLFCNAPTIIAETLDNGIEILRKKPDCDSCVTVSKYNMWGPLRARKIDAEGFLQPFVPFENFSDARAINCDRDSQGDVWYADMGVSMVRPRCLDNISNGLLPQRWMGRKIYPLKQWGGCDVDCEWQIPMVEYWLKKHGFTESHTPYE